MQVVWSEQLYRVFEVDPASFRSSHSAFLEFVHPQDREKVDEAFARSFDKHAVSAVEHRIVTSSGLVKFVEERWRVLHDDQGRPVRAVGTCQDITERRLAEVQLHAMAEMLDAAPSSITVHDSQGRFLFVNRKTREIHGYDEREFMALNLRDVNSPENKALFEGRMRTVAENGETTFEVEHVRKDGTRVPLEVFVKHVEWGGAPALLAVATELTERKRAEQERARLEAQLQQAQKMESVGRLAGGVAHDFNNMLSVILGRAELALAQVDPTLPLHADLEEILGAATRSANLTGQLLAFARKQTVAPQVLDLNEAVARMLQMLHRIIGENIDLTWQPEADLWPVKVDPSQIDQILTNLCINARDAISGVGKVTIKTGNRTFDAGSSVAHAESIHGDYVLLTVSDSGCGMDGDTQSHLFEPFFTTKVMGRGAGLGLATVYGIIKQNNGFINVDSEPTRGTTFTVYLPRHVARAGQAQMEGAPGLVPSGHETILVVEDERSILTLATKMLEKRGYTVLAASSPSEAFRLAREHTGEIHLLLTDVIMPEMNGRDLAKNLLSLHPNIKCLFTSGYTANVIAHHGVLDEGTHFVQKPFSAEHLATKVRNALDAPR